MLPLEPYLRASVLTAGAILIAAGAIAAARQRPRTALVLIVALGTLLRVYAATDAFPHLWDEAFHAVVAKHCMVNPFKPVLYHAPALPYDYRDWLANHVWLHKPPLALWLIAASYHLFGINEFALRAPSIALSIAMIVLVYRMGLLLGDWRHGLLAAALCAVNAHLIELASGREATDHVDMLLVALVTAGAFTALRAAAAPHLRRFDIAAGVLTGLACLAKGLPGLFIAGLWAVAVAAHGPCWRREALRGLRVAAIAVAIAAPWSLYTRWAFPLESAWESGYSLRHLAETLEGHAKPWHYYLGRLGVWLGPIAYLAIPWALARLARRSPPPALVFLLLWFGIPHLLFSFVATKMPSYVTIAAGAGFLLIAFLLLDAPAYLSNRFNRRTPRILLQGVLLVILLLPTRQSLKQLHLRGRYDRHPAWAQQLRDLAADCPNPDAVVFAVPHHIEAMFYGNFTAYNYLPTRDVVQRLLTSGREIAAFDRGRTPGWVYELEGLRIYRPRSSLADMPKPP
jgi:hypothetical protein